MRYRIPKILTYHALEKCNSKSKYSILQNDFEMHLKYINENNYNCITVEELYEIIKKRKYENLEKTLLISFDDGAESDFSVACPLLRKYKIRATFFITSAFIEKPGYLSISQIKGLLSQGMSIQSHGKTHSFLDSKKINIYEELLQSKIQLQKLIGKKVDFISAPGGRYDKRTINLAKKAGYLAFFTSNPYQITIKSEIPVIGRSMVKYLNYNTNFMDVVKVTNSKMILSKATNYLKRHFRKIIGDKAYQYAWNKYNIKKF